MTREKQTKPHQSGHKNGIVIYFLCTGALLACMFVACVPRCPRDKKTALDPLELTGVTDVS